MTHGIVV